MVDVPADAPAVRLGVLLDLDPGNLGEALADAAAFDAAGADALWVDPGPEPELDVLALTAALAVVTFRARLMVALPSSGVAPAGLARTLRTVERLCRGRLVLVADAERQCAELDAMAPATAVLRRVPGEPDVFDDPRGGGRQRWITVPAPQGRASWQDIRADAAGREASGLVVPADPRLLDMLRNPDDPDDRSDLQLAQG